MKKLVIVCSLFILSFFIGCEEVQTPVDTNKSSALERLGQPEIVVNNEDSLYKYVNDPSKAGYCIVIASRPTSYMLNPNQTNGGRIELQYNMSLRSQSGNPDDVVIDASLLSKANLTDGFLTGAIRVGKGFNSIDGLTVKNAKNGAAAIETDLDSNSTLVMINNVKINGNQRGIDVRNINSAMANRQIKVEITNCVISNNTSMGGQGIRFINTNSANNSSIQAKLLNNVIEGNKVGFLAANLNASSSTIMIVSKNNMIDGNGNGCIFLTGNSDGSISSDNNSITFTAQKGSIQNSDSTLIPIALTSMTGGIIAIGGNSPNIANHSSNNNLNIKLQDVKFGNNDGPDIKAFGAWTTAVLPAGTNNIVKIILQGLSKTNNYFKDDSQPDEPAGTNKVQILQQ